MEDAALFYRHTALGCFHRRRKYLLLSPEWRHEVDDARRFIRACRDNWDDRPREIVRTVYALGPRVRLQRPRPMTDEERQADDATPIEARRALVQQIARQVFDLCRAYSAKASAGISSRRAIQDTRASSGWSR